MALVQLFPAVLGVSEGVPKLDTGPDAASWEYQLGFLGKAEEMLSLYDVVGDFEIQLDLTLLDTQQCK